MTAIAGKQLGTLVKLLDNAAIQFNAAGFATAGVGFLRLPFALGTTPIYLASDDGAGGSFEILSRNIAGELYFGNYIEDPRFHANSRMQFELFAPGIGYTFNGYLGDPILSIWSDTFKTVSRGRAGYSGDGTISSLRPSVNTTATTVDSAIVHIVLQDDAITLVESTVVAWDTVTNEFASFRHAWTFSKIAGVVTASTGVQPAAIDVGHSAGAVGVNLNYAVNGDGIDIQVTPWSANSTHWTVLPLQTVNANLF